MAHSINYKVKLDDYQDVHDLAMKKGFKPKKTLSRADCTMRPHNHSYYNSDMFLPMLARQHKALVNGKSVLFLDNLPPHITVKDCGFLHEVTIELPETFK